MNITDKKYQQIIDFISGEIDEEGRRELELWLNASKLNQAEFQRIRKKILFTQWSLKTSALNTNLEFNKFEKRLGSPVRYLSYVAVAASIVLLFSIGAPYFWDNANKDQISIAQTSNIEPGKRGAELILSTGKKIEIEDLNQLIQEKDGSKIQIDSLNRLKYKSKREQNQKEIYNTLSVPRGREFDILLADGTHVWLNADSELRYPVQFNGKQRQVYLKGQAHFKVSPDKERAFLVNSYDQQVKVYGTEFCVNAYNENKITTVLVEGSVGVRPMIANKETKLEPNQLAVTDTKTGEVQISKVNVRPYIAWKDGDFVFENQNLEEIMLRIERWYNVKVFFMNEEVKQTRFTCDVERYAKAGDLLYFMQETSNVKFEIKKNTIVVMSK